MAKFLTALDVELIAGDTWALHADLVYQSDVGGCTYTVPKGFETDFASVPRLPVAFWLTGNCAHAAAVVHDYLYSTASVARKLADRVLLEAMSLTNVPAWRRYSMYWAVRLFGGFARES